MNVYSTEFSIPPRHAALPELQAWLGTACAAQGIGSEASSRLQLLAEELFINTVDHAFAGKTGPDVRVQLSHSASGTCLRYVERAAPFDPTPPAAVPAAGSGPGGLGIALLQGMCRKMNYRREDDCNIVELWL